MPSPIKEFFNVFLIVLVILDVILGVYSVKDNLKKEINVIFACFCWSIALWTFGIFMFNIVSQSAAYFWNKFFIFSAALIPSLFVHFVHLFLAKPLSGKKKCLLYSFPLLVSLLLVFSPHLFSQEIIDHDWGRESVLGQFYPYYGVAFILLMSYGFFRLFLKLVLDASGLERERIKTVLWGTLPASIVGAYFNLILILQGNYKFIILGPYCSVIIIFFFTYAIIHYRFLDISLIITRAGFFLLVYSFVLGIPFLLIFSLEDLLRKNLGENWWLFPMLLSTFLATAGPFVYLFIEKKAERRLQEEQLQYRETLQHASAGMGRVKDIRRLLDVITHLLTRTIRLSYAAIFLWDKDKEDFKIKSFRSWNLRFKTPSLISGKSCLVEALRKDREPIVYAELQQRELVASSRYLVRLLAELKRVSAEVVVPSFIEDRLIAIFVLGNKISGKPFSDDDLAAFSILANQAALAIENTQFYEEMKQTHEQLFKAEKMATIGIMADGLSHQINNRLHALGFIAGDILDTLRMKKDVFNTPEAEEVRVDIEHALARIEENVTQGGEVVRGLLKYSRKSEEDVADVPLEQVIDAAVEMARFKIKFTMMDFVREIPADLPPIRGRFTQLQEVFFNLIDNAYDAMMQRKEDLREEGYRPRILISARPTADGFLEIVVEDNGIGIKEEDRKKLFTPFFTTKLSSKKGTGLGLYVIQRLIEENHKGTVSYESKYGEGTRVRIRLPAAKVAA